MKTRVLIIIVIAIALSIPTTMWPEQAFASCVAEIDFDLVLEESELVFTGTVTRLDNYNGPQKVTFLVHDVIKGQINTPKFVFENSNLQFLDNDTIMTSSVDVDYKIGKTYKVFVVNGETNNCTTKITAPPAGYMWEPGPEDGNYYSENPEFVNPCEEGYGLSDGVCITLEEMNKDLPTCSANPQHDFGKCKKNTEEPPNSFEQVKEHCENGGDDIFMEWWDDDLYYNNAECIILDRDGFGAPPPLIPEPEPEQDNVEYQNCGPGTTLQDGICVVDSENENSDTGTKWGGPYPDTQENPNLNTMIDYDYSFMYMIILMIAGIIGAVVIGVVIMIKRKRK